MARPYPPEGQPPSYYGYPSARRRHGFLGPLILIALGVIFLLQNLGLLSWNIWGSLWRLWPVVLILIGLELFLGGMIRSAIGGALVGLLLLVVLGLAVAGAAMHFNFSAPAPGPVRTQTETQALQDARSANVTVRFGAGSLNLGPLQDPGNQLAQMTYDGPENFTPSVSYRVRNGLGQLAYGLTSHGGPPFRPPFFGGGDSGGGSGQMDLMLNTDVPLTLDLQEGAADSKIDLSQLHVSNLQLQTGASTTNLTLPQAAGATTATIRGGASTINVQVPDGVAAQIHYEGGLSTLNIDTNRFPAISGDRMYRSPDYDSAGNKVDLTIQAGVATVNVR